MSRAKCKKNPDLPRRGIATRFDQAQRKSSVTTPAGEIYSVNPFVFSKSRTYRTMPAAMEFAISA